MMEFPLGPGDGDGLDEGEADLPEDGDPVLRLSRVADFAAEPMVHAHSKNADPKIRRKSVFILPNSKGCTCNN
jgi:hypothetical protein